MYDSFPAGSLTVTRIPQLIRLKSFSFITVSTCMNSNGLLQVEGDVPEELAQEEEDQDHDAVAQLGGRIVQVLQQVLQEEGLQANRNIVNRYCGYLHIQLKNIFIPHICFLTGPMN